MKKTIQFIFFMLLSAVGTVAVAAESTGGLPQYMGAMSSVSAFAPAEILGLRVTGMREELSHIKARLDRARRLEAPGSRHLKTLEKRVANLQKKVAIAQAHENRLIDIEIRVDKLESIQ